MISHISTEAREPEDHPLRLIRAMVNASLKDSRRSLGFNPGLVSQMFVKG